MRSLEIRGIAGDSKILVGAGFDTLAGQIPHENVVIVTDSQVRALYQKKFPPFAVLEIGVGEEIKTLDTVKRLYAELLALEADRSTFIVGIGGGIVCDVAGFAAATYMRGLRFGFVPTTLLAQVDAGVGGKNGVNFKGYKNMVGTFRQPEFLICDPELLKTLPRVQILSGLAEVVKHAALGGASLFDYLETNYLKALAVESTVMERLVFDSIKLKAEIVNRDATEQGERRKLNFGHTFGHAIEKISSLPHGHAVSIGMALAADISLQKGLLSAQENQRLKTLLANLKLPIRTDIDAQSLFEVLKKDKKRQGENLYFVMLEHIGSALIQELPLRQIEILAKQILT